MSALTFTDNYCGWNRFVVKAQSVRFCAFYHDLFVVCENSDEAKRKTMTASGWLFNILRFV